MYSRVDFQRAIEEGNLNLGPHKDIQSASVNMTIAELWNKRERILNPLTEPTGPYEPPDLETYLREACVPKPLNPATGAWHFEPDEFCIGFLHGPMRFAAGQYIRVRTRSSYARIGLSIRETEDALTFGHGFTGKVPIVLTSDTHCALYPDESPAQLTNEPRNFPLIVAQQPLSLHETLLLYDGKTVLSKRWPETVKRAFRPFSLSPEGFVFTKEFLDLFFLGSTRETVEIPPSCAGYLPESLGRMDEPIPPIRLHSAAPWIMPGDRLTITLECRIKYECLLSPGMPLPSLEYRALDTPLAETTTSRYHGQNGATLSR